MKILILTIGKTQHLYLKEYMDQYISRINHYNNIDFLELKKLKNVKNYSSQEIIDKEGSMMLKKILPSDYIVVLDNKGKEYSSIDFSTKMKDLISMSKQRLVFIIGGSYGISKKIYNHSHESVSLSKMTFSHQMVKLFFLEQLYRSFTIMNNQPYHHE